jgi:hypothetical protein
MRRLPPVALAIALIAWMADPSVVLAESAAPETFAGDLWSRPRLTGDWFGYRETIFLLSIFAEIYTTTSGGPGTVRIRFLSGSPPQQRQLSQITLTATGAPGSN